MTETKAQRDSMKFYFLLGVTVAETVVMLPIVYRDATMSKRQVYE